MWNENNEAWVFPEHYNQVFFYPNVLDMYSWFILRHDLRSKHIFEKNNVIMSSEEDNQGEGNKK
jgi:hypothetical protein